MYFKKITGTKKGAILSHIRKKNKYIEISQLRGKDRFYITLLCEMEMIPLFSYYKEESVLETENKMLMTGIIKIYGEVGGVYGYRRMIMNLNRRLG